VERAGPRARVPRWAPGQHGGEQRGRPQVDADGLFVSRRGRSAIRRRGGRSRRAHRGVRAYALAVRKGLSESTPAIQGVSRIEREYEASDQRRFFVPSPNCRALRWLKFERLRWDKGKPEITNYECDACNAAIEDHKTAMLAAAEAADPGTIGFHLSALYSPVGWFSWWRRSLDRSKMAQPRGPARTRARPN
jgi:hypothetical protein